MVTGFAMSEKVKEELVLRAEDGVSASGQGAAAAIVGLIAAGDEDIGSGAAMGEGTHLETVLTVEKSDSVCEAEAVLSDSPSNVPPSFRVTTF